MWPFTLSFSMFAEYMYIHDIFSSIFAVHNVFSYTPFYFLLNIFPETYLVSVSQLPLTSLIHKECDKGFFEKSTSPLAFLMHARDGSKILYSKLYKIL